MDDVAGWFVTECWWIAGGGDDWWGKAISSVGFEGSLVYFACAASD